MFFKTKKASSMSELQTSFTGEAQRILSEQEEMKKAEESKAEKLKLEMEKATEKASQHNDEMEKAKSFIEKVENMFKVD